MGYITYVGGSLIVAVAIHVLWTKAQEESKPTAALQAGKAASSNEHVDGGHEGLETAVPVLNFEDDGADSGPPSSRSDSPPSISVSEDIATAGKPLSATYHRPGIPMPPPSQPIASAPVSDLKSTTKVEIAPPALVAPRTRSPPRLKPPTTSVAPTRSGQSPLGPPPSAAASLRVPQQKVLTNTHMQPSTSTQHPSKRASRKVILSPGHSPLDWASLTKSTAPSAPVTLRGKDATEHLGAFRMGRITPSQLKHQNGRKGKDAWTSYQGRVYNIGAYLDFHPGGVDELMKGAGRSSDKLFAEVHPWVNWEGMLGGCLIGMLVSDDDPAALGRDASGSATDNILDEMD